MMAYFIALIVVYGLRKVKKQSIRPKTLLLMKLDTLGDYVLFRNFLQPLREAYADYEITFLCNMDFLEILHACDRSYVDHVIPLDTRKWSDAHKWFSFQRCFYRSKILYLLNQQTYEVVISPVFHRFSRRDDFLVRFINAQHKIGSQGFELVEQWHMNTTSLKPHDRVYTTLLDATFEVLFAFERNREFFSQLLQRPLTEVKYHLCLPPLPANSSLLFPAKNYGVFFLGASDRKRQWALVSWVALAQKISPQIQIVLCGSKKEIPDAMQIIAEIPQALNLVGKTTFVELLHVLSKAHFIVSNETAIPHFCVALGLGPIFVISNGNTFGRFVPYPKHMDANYHVVYHPKIEALLQSPHGFGRCLEIYKRGVPNLQFANPPSPIRPNGG
ncbi:glycosyltransferase family 9 protein [Helicobacter felistomachi]|uniref:glycosyltransferase family 9 protein n=1 Tax=Helicobacter felistomachi TaxID=3040201 RepID=UPI002572CDBD|nr:glycosyltransferase family 9 protein [Helicobacter sp. NHP21005]